MHTSGHPKLRRSLSLPYILLQANPLHILWQFQGNLPSSTIIAPGPPSEIAVATPMMLPVPIVAAKDVANAPNWLMSPDESESLVKDIFIAVKIFRCGNFSATVKNRWVPKRRIIVGHPHNASDSFAEKDTRSKERSEKHAIVLILGYLCEYNKINCQFISAKGKCTLKNTYIYFLPSCV